jgi:hypothetical protein
MRSTWRRKSAISHSRLRLLNLLEQEQADDYIVISQDSEPVRRRLASQRAPLFLILQGNIGMSLNCQETLRHIQCQSQKCHKHSEVLALLC